MFLLEQFIPKEYIMENLTLHQLLEAQQQFVDKSGQ